MNSNQAHKENTELQYGLGNVDQQDNKDSNYETLAEYKEVEGTPFTLAKKDKDWYVLIGKYRMSEAFETEEQAETDAKRIDWDRVMQVMGVMIENYNEKNK